VKAPFLSIELAGEEMWLLAQKALYRPTLGQLIISDVHLGKTAHFRKAGIPLPQQGQWKDIDRIDYLIKQLQPASVLFLGDLFHSDYNREWLHFKALLASHPSLQFILVEGNHDILQDSHYNMSNLHTAEFIEEGRLLFTHYPVEAPLQLNICGHIHPGITLGGLAKQSISLPCFFHSAEHFILPAFGSLTGIYPLDYSEVNNYYVVYHNKVRKV
jgi:DNA ligase-associated metallophosphoesterase